ncbi:TetR/AcrR family transcriptional regulator [Streptomyces sp. NPDC006610]|jgi:AcrR family transcriptional regulator|uniref:TetR/AcrR family transcriptional regulator n=1 Tax=Streptomyces sp. NPDC006610 TaxID=3154584 RepID=UPI0033A6FD93
MTPSLPQSPGAPDPGGLRDRTTSDALVLDGARPAGRRGTVRADAARNRARLLHAAAELVAERGVGGLTMEAVAVRARVGKGTVFRRFGNRTGLVMALLEETEETYRRALREGPPPLGPGAPAVERIEAFGLATLRHWAGHGELYLAARPDSVLCHGTSPQQVKRDHLHALLREAVPGADTELLTETLLGFLDVGLYSYLVHHRGLDPQRVEAGWRNLVARLVTPV